MSDMPRKIALLAAFAILGCSDTASREAPTRTEPLADSAKQEDTRATILFLGTSLTAGYGVGAENSFPAVIQQKIDSVQLPFRVVNAGLSGETSAGGLRRLDWSLQHPVDVLVLELGANDGLRGLSVRQMHANLDSIMARTRHRYPDAEILMAGMEAPPNLGAAYTKAFRETYRDLARKYGADLIPFLLDGVAAQAAMNQEDGIHPNIEGHKRIANTLWTELEPMLKRVSAKRVTAARE